MSPTAHSIQEAIEQAQNILVITHMSPDGDAVGSLTAVGVALTHWDKQVLLMCDDPVPGRFYYLPLAAKVQRPGRNNPVVDLVIAVDCGDEQRMGQSFANLPQPHPFTINIDHHVTNSRFGQINLVVETAVSTTEILFDLFTEWGLPLDAGLAASLLTGLVTDTLGFRTVGTNAKTLKMASTLVEAGADLPLITAQGLNLKQFSTMRLWRYGLDGMKLENGLIWTTITNKQRKAAGFLGASSNGLSNLLADVDEAAIGVVIMEMGDSTVRVGWRCRPPYNVAEIAQKLGGGGHSLAAGCTIIGPLDEVEEQVVMISKEAIRKQKGD